MCISNGQLEDVKRKLIDLNGKFASEIEARDSLTRQLKECQEKLAEKEMQIGILEARCESIKESKVAVQKELVDVRHLSEILALRSNITNQIFKITEDFVRLCMIWISTMDSDEHLFSN